MGHNPTGVAKCNFAVEKSWIDRSDHCPIIARFLSSKNRNEFLTKKRELKNIEDSTSSFVKISHLCGISY